MKLWSAVPTPLDVKRHVDEKSLERMLEAAVADHVEGIFLAGTCGEGPWLPNRERWRLVRAAVAIARGRLQIAVQASDNSADRILDNIDEASKAGADLAIIAPPAVLLNATTARIVSLYKDVAAHSALPLGIYDLGAQRAFAIPEDRLEEVYLLPQVRLVKDSSGDAQRRAAALAARRCKAELRLFNGNEFKCTEYLDAGYDGAMFGGAVATASLTHRIADLHASGDAAAARQADADMQALLFGIYGGPTIPCWLTGLKYFLKCRGVFATDVSFLEYPLSEECRSFIQRITAVRRDATRE